LLNVGVQWAEVDLPSDLLGQLQLPDRQDWQTFWAGIQQRLQSGSVEDLAEWMPYARIGLLLLGQVEGGEPYAAWLRQRLDYFEMANTALVKVPGAKPPPRPILPPVTPGRKVSILPPARKPVANPVPAVERQREVVIENTALWRRKIVGRPVPEGARELAPKLKAVFTEEGIPAPLVWLAEVESSMNPEARNPSGAVGLFQLMPATARRFGLSTFPVDERNHPEKSARAAARYLRFLYGRFDSWPLAVAAYNSGEGRLRDAMKATGGRTFEAVAPGLPIETRMYVPKVAAVVSVREGIEDLRLPGPSGVAAGPGVAWAGIQGEAGAFHAGARLAAMPSRCDGVALRRGARL
jgi:membrane-bound lytic murein transglycosylase D